MLVAARVLQLLATIAAVLLATRRRSYRPIAAYLAAIFTANTLRAVLVALILEPARARMRAEGLDPTFTPFTSAADVAAAGITIASSLLGPAALAALALEVFTRRPPHALVAGAWALSSGLLAGLYPAVRGARLGVVFTGAELVALLVVVVSAATWARRRKSPSAEQAAVMLFASMTGGAMLVTRGALFTAWTPLADAVLLVGYSAITLTELAAWTCSSRCR